jgi:general secretion pathway protein G
VREAASRLAHVWRRRDPTGGWTFIETIIVIAIVLILTSSVGVMAFRYVDRARMVAARSQIENYSMALHSYYLDNQRYPTNDQGLDALWTAPILDPVPTGWDGPYTDRAIVPDPWSNPYEYETPGANGLPFGIQSYGADGAPGGTAADADITSWSAE